MVRQSQPASPISSVSATFLHEPPRSRGLYVACFTGQGTAVQKRSRAGAHPALRASRCCRRELPNASRGPNLAQRCRPADLDGGRSAGPDGRTMAGAKKNERSSGPRRARSCAARRSRASAAHRSCRVSRSNVQGVSSSFSRSTSQAMAGLSPARSTRSTRTPSAAAISSWRRT